MQVYSNIHKTWCFSVSQSLTSAHFFFNNIGVILRKCDLLRRVITAANDRALLLLLSVWEGPAPGSHCEVFINQIPRDTYEDLLIPLFSSVGPLWEFRLMMNFSGQNRGFAYAKYALPTQAAAAVHSLHCHDLGGGVRLSVRRSTEKRHLCLEPLPLNIGRERLLKVGFYYFY